MLTSLKAQFQRLQLNDTMVMSLAFGMTSVINYLFSLAMGWLLLPGNFGLLSFAQTIILIIGLILNSGVAWSLTATLVNSEHDKSALIRSAYLQNLLLALSISAGLVMLYATGIIRDGLESIPMLVVIVLTIPSLSFVAIINGAFRGLQNFKELAFTQVLEIGVKAVAGLVFVFLGWGTVGAVAGFLVGGVIAAVIGHIRLARCTGGIPVFGQMIWLDVWTTLGMFFALLGMALILNTDIIMLKLLTSAERSISGYYQAGIMLANAPYYFTTALLAILFPRLVNTGDISHSSKHVADTLKIVLIFLLPLEILMALRPVQILTLLFPDHYAGGATALQLLALGNVALIFLAVLSTTFQATGHAMRSGRILLLSIAIEVPVLLLTIPRWGITGAALSFAGSCIFALTLHVYFYVRQLGFARLATGSRWLAYYSLCLVGGVLILHLTRIFQINLIASVSLTGAIYLALLVGFGVLSLPSRLNPTNESL